MIPPSRKSGASVVIHCASSGRGGVEQYRAVYLNGARALAEVLAPAIVLADGYPIEAQTADAIERNKAKIKEWPDSARIMLPHAIKPGAPTAAGALVLGLAALRRRRR